MVWWTSFEAEYLPWPAQSVISHESSHDLHIIETLQGVLEEQKRFPPPASHSDRATVG